VDHVSYSVAGAMLDVTRHGVHDLVTRGKLARPQLLLLHGLGGSAEDWREFAGLVPGTADSIAFTTVSVAVTPPSPGDAARTRRACSTSSWRL
jgi:pimeloyl-ACP methyl ester carboxylesterase